MGTDCGNAVRGRMMAASQEPGGARSRLAVHQGGCYTTPMYLGERRSVGLVGCLVVVVLWPAAGSRAAMGNGVFQGFTEHITRQIARDKMDFAEAESCTSWFYQQLKKSLPERPEARRLSFADDGSDQHSCATRYPGINEARAAFAQSQSFLSLSLTFYQLALVADRDDNEQYDAVELQDILDSLQVAADEPAVQPLAMLNGTFDDVRQAVEFTVVIAGMQALYNKGYRLSPADQAAMGRVSGAS